LNANPPISSAAAAAAPSRAISTLHASFSAQAGRSQLVRVHESGALRLRLPRQAAPLEGIIVNTGGGVLGGDRLDLRFSLESGASAIMTSVAAEKIYRSEAEPAVVSTSAALAAGTRLDWLPQETILFDQAKLHRSLDITMAGDATLLAAETLVFGRLAMGETATSGELRDRWRLVRDGHLVFADATTMSGAFAGILDRPALGRGARAVALLLYAAPDAASRLEDLRARLAEAPGVEAGASAFNGILVARLLARSPDRLRTVMIAALASLRSGPLPRVWQS
jgi:urease accessory protein